MIFPIYSICIFFYRTYIQLASIFSSKAKKWIVGRKGWKTKLKKNSPDGGFDLWLHCSSLGEFEQGRPVLEAYKKQFPKAKILLSFFSPSGYEIRKNYPVADYTCYLPVDTLSNARSWLDIAKPKQIIFVKYDFWFNFLNEIKSRGILAILISANFSSNHFFNSKLGALFSPALEAFQIIFFQEKPAFEVPAKIEQQIVGDTRVDRVLQIQNEVNQNIGLLDWKGEKKLMIWGSVWPSDYPILNHALLNSLKEWKHIIAPHEPSEKQLDLLGKVVNQDAQLFSEHFLAKNNIIIVDSIGQLAGLYKNGDAAYIGGGFGDGIHNTLEPLAASCPVVFGPNFQKFPEAINGISSGCSFAIDSITDFEKVVASFKDQIKLEGLKQKSIGFIAANRGATETILEYLTLGHGK